MTSDQPPHLADSLRRRGCLVSSWPWRALTYAATTMPIAGVLAVLAVLTYLRTGRSR